MKKKAFTLTELLVVVVIIGVLSAVVLPKFNKVIESRRTAEAESVMRAVRNEQEMRCTLDQNYTTNKDKLAVWPKQDSANYTYALNAGGMSATRKDKDYTLEIKTYLDGGICCRGTYCASLNKDYPLCKDYEATPNTKDCVPEIVGEEGEVQVESEQNQEPELCEPTHDGQSTYTEDCPTGQEGSITYTWDVNTCTYEAQEHCSACSPTHNGQSTYTEDCSFPLEGSIVHTWNATTCEYETQNNCSSCKPTNNGQRSYKEKCDPEIQLGSYNVQVGSETITVWRYAMVTYTWNDELCAYEKDESACTTSSNNNSDNNYNPEEYDCSCSVYYQHASIPSIGAGSSVQVGSQAGNASTGSCAYNTNSGPHDIAACYCPQEQACREYIAKWQEGIYPGSGSCNFNCSPESTNYSPGGSIASMTVSYSQITCSCRRKN